MRGHAMCMALSLAIGCGGGGTLRGAIYEGPEARYRIGELGAGWSRLDLAQNDLAWRGDDGAVVQLNATCDPFQDVPLSSLTNHLLIGFTERDLRAQELVPLDGREALRSHYLARLDGVPRELLLYVLKKDECTYDFALVAPPGASFERARPAFERFVAGFTTEAG
ncbi:MAG: hypothetical protein KF729_04450 [Sandaracinaceae bacterium]|nr:hypothetical protein [Sandaracinaceae bacterium]